MRTDPIIVVGMHRSGTSLVSECIDALGVHFGADLQSDHESKFFIDLNGWIMSQSNSHWDNVQNVKYLYENETLKSKITKKLIDRLEQKKSIRYWGCKKQARNELIWGWKDPRNTLTLPIWLELFPQARIIQVDRHGIDVANSLLKRTTRRTNANIAVHDRRQLLSKVLNLNTKFSPSARCTSFEGCFTLWEEHMQILAGYRKSYFQNENNFFELKYEAVLDNPKSTIEELSHFLGLSENKGIYKEIRFDSSRAYHFRKEANYERKYVNYIERARHYGYLPTAG